MKSGANLLLFFELTKHFVTFFKKKCIFATQSIYFGNILHKNMSNSLSREQVRLW